MQAGFVVDRTYGANLQSTWLAGDPHTAKLFGISTGSVEIDEKQLCPVTCFRCPGCSYLEFYAFAPSTDDAKATLLRPAQGTLPAEAQQMLRASTAPEEYDDEPNKKSNS